MGSTKTTNNTYFFQNKPLFGLDIGNGTLKVMQVDEASIASHHPAIIGYGTANFDKSAVENGTIVKPEIIAGAILELFKHHLIGDITTRRVALSIPSYRTFTRSISLPQLGAKELRAAVELEAEQYVPVPLDELYLDYTLIRETKEGSEVFAVGVPKKIVDSYLVLMNLLGLEAVLIETTLSGAGRLFTQDRQSDVTSVIIDFGSASSDISIFDKTVVVTGTVQAGGVVFSNSIRDKLGVTQAEASIIKTKYGLGVSKRQKEITESLEPALQQIIKEIRRMIRYYEERYGTERPIKQVVTLGGGANMPGLIEYLTSSLRLAVRPCDPWQYFSYKGLQAPAQADKPMFATVAGLSLVNSKEVLL